MHALMTGGTATPFLRCPQTHAPCRAAGDMQADDLARGLPAPGWRRQQGRRSRRRAGDRPLRHRRRVGGPRLEQRRTAAAGCRGCSGDGCCGERRVQANPCGRRRCRRALRLRRPQLEHLLQVQWHRLAPHQPGSRPLRPHFLPIAQHLVQHKVGHAAALHRVDERVGIFGCHRYLSATSARAPGRKLLAEVVVAADLVHIRAAVEVNSCARLLAAASPLAVAEDGERGLGACARPDLGPLHVGQTLGSLREEGLDLARCDTPFAARRGASRASLSGAPAATRARPIRHRRDRGGCNGNDAGRARGHR
mmetsp:Transcript_15772/g.44927  ORF Transcript_15772/g.44927 Transcript_15772/m.44927 type:complete len:308 (+) Transcript_15772:518-1441(+)